MATASAVDNTLVCGVCLESYKGRNPKLLPCDHTFCLSCLRDLEQRAVSTASAVDAQKTGDDGQTEEEKKASFPCPTCRTAIEVPAGGVSQFQTNFYLDHEDIPCSHSLTCGFCEEGQEARYVCTTCAKNLCARCRRCHEKLAPSHAHSVQPLPPWEQTASQSDLDLRYEGPVTEHIMLLEAALAGMGEEERELRRQRQAADDTISRRADRCRLMATQAEGVSRKGLAQLADTLARDIKGQMGAARRKHTQLSQLLQHGDTSVTLDDVQRCLLSDDDLHLYQQRHPRGRQLAFFLHTFSDDVFDQAIAQSYIGVVSSKREAEVTSTDCTDQAVCSGNEAKEMSLLEAAALSLPSVLDATELFQRMTSLQEDNNRLQELVDLLRQTVTKVTEDNTKLQQDVYNSRQSLGNLSEDTSKVQEEVKDIRSLLVALKPDISTLQQGTLSLAADLESHKRNNSGLEKHLDAIQQEVAAMKESHCNLLQETKTLQQITENVTRENSLTTAHVGQLQLEISTIHEKNSIAHQRFETLQKAFTGLKDKSSLLVAFHARLTSLSSASTRGAILLDEVKCNVGKAYNKATGVFKAPVTGIYLFLSTLLRPSPAGDAELCIVVDGSRVTWSVPHESEAGEGSSCTSHVVHRLTAGQKVWLKVWSVGDIGFLGGLSFSGTLIRPEL